MKVNNILVGLIVCCITAFAEIAEDQMKHLKQSVRINSVQDETFRSKTREKFEVLKIRTSRSRDDAEVFCMRMTVELESRKDGKRTAQLMRRQGKVNSEYNGDDLWEFHIPHGDLERPKIEAYVVEYGVMDGQTFVPVAVDCDHAESADEILERSMNPIDETLLVMKHAYSSVSMDNGSEVIESYPRPLRK